MGVFAIFVAACAYHIRTGQSPDWRAVPPILLGWTAVGAGQKLGRFSEQGCLFFLHLTLAKC